ncbi:MAG TPA: SurA N-terminal domain-containing protein [Pseudonocardia sp.]|jgi:hypothetical protein|nr:SurA N-terminal domain-containing protein [Pseudonocardia sp.]
MSVAGITGPVRLMVPRLVVVGLVVLLLALAAGTVIAGYRERSLPHDAVLRVGHAVVSEEQFATRATLLTVLYRVVPPADPEGRNAYRRAIAKAVALSTVLDQQARARGTTVTDREVGERLDDLVTVSFPDGPDAFAARLASAGLGRRELLAEVRHQLTTARLFDQVTAAVPAPSDVELAAVARRSGQRPDERLRLLVLARHRQDTWVHWLGDVLRSARVRYAESYRPVDPDTVTPDTVTPDTAGSRLPDHRAAAPLSAPARR